MSAEGGTVYLVGAGPGDPRLITVRAVELVATADVILYDRLIPPGVVEAARADAKVEYVGKQPGGHALSQEEINDLLVKHARAGRSVVRLKGGDPFIFGRGGEEALALEEAGVKFEVVPGVSAGAAVPAYAGIPVTHRDLASAVAFVTGHECDGKGSEAIDWNALASFPGTLVLFMGVRNLETIASKLIDAGKGPEVAVAVVERGTTPKQRVVTGTLSDIAGRAEEEGIKPPALTVVGPVAELRSRLAWFERAPLHGIKVAVTRARDQASDLAKRLGDLGAEVVQAPAIRIKPRIDSAEVRDAVSRIESYGLICLTSPNGVKLLFEALVAAGKDARSLAGSEIAAIGPGTARALASHGIAADVVPERSVAESLADELEGLSLKEAPVLLARAAEARDVLPERLKGMGADVDEVALYETEAEPLPAELKEGLEDVDYLTFASSSTVRFFLSSLGSPAQLPERARVISIGPVTSATARELGLTVHAEAERHDIEGLVEALLADSSG